MTAERDLDRQLVSWFDERAILHVPDGLLERSLGRVGATRQRPGWLVPDAWRSPHAAGRPARMPARWGRLLAVTAAVVVVLGGASLLFSLATPPIAAPSPVLSVSPGPSTSGAPAPTPGVTFEASPPATDRAFTTRPGMFDAAGSALLASDTVGWVSTRSNTIYRTRDMGASWTEVRPPGWSTTGLIRFVDADTLYVASAYAGLPNTGGGPVAIAATHDGGDSWVEATIDSPRLMAGMGFSFRTPDRGTLTFFTQDGTDLRVFETADGGRTWSGPVRSSAPRMPYLLKDLSGDRVLVLANASAPGRPFDNSLNLSMDGGLTWIKPSFPIGPHSPEAEVKAVAGLWADGGGRIVLAMDIFGGDLQIYTSPDDGQTWQFVKDLGRDIGPVQLLSATEWIFVKPSGVLSTVDAGGHWRSITGPSKIELFDVSFVSPDRGWALLDCFDYPTAYPNLYCAAPKPGVRDETVVFLATSDGGRTWTRAGR